MKNYKLVPMDRSHIPAIAQIERECFSAPWSEAMLEEELYNPLASFIVAQRPDGAVLGYAGLHEVMDEGYIDNQAVREDYRGNGIAGCVCPFWQGASRLSYAGSPSLQRPCYPALL